mmetsp:Transcript_1473/g.2591  ORF Transcript_1473/g.2591 Transcript_1473/m.2591 type:complete len:105 (-) Transcript_1473:2179-2493(-)
MKNRANFLVMYLDGQNEMKQENMYGYDSERKNGGKFDERGGQEKKESKSKTCLQNIIIIPSESSWLGIWNFIVHISLFWGYFNDPYHIAFVLSRVNGHVKDHGA